MPCVTLELDLRDPNTFGRVHAQHRENHGRCAAPAAKEPDLLNPSSQTEVGAADRIR
jgi:hypothetical protein